MDIQTLREISSAVLDKIRRSKSQKEVLDLLDMYDYHGFMKSRLPDEFITSILSPLALTSKDVQVEVVSVSIDLRDQVHIHKEATALVTTLGETENLPAPFRATAFLNSDWSRAMPNQEIVIPAGTAHGFTVERGGILYFLSVQSPPIERKDGHDDYHLVNV